MKPGTHLPQAALVGGIILFSLTLHVCAAFFSEGRAHPDSDYQILEFAHSKIDTGMSLTLPWEFFEQIRPAVQPAIAYGVYQYGSGPDPFSTALVLRLISAGLGFVSIWLLCGYALRWLSQGWARTALVLLTGFFWLLPFLNARFASEAWAGAFLCLGILLMLVACDEKHRSSLALAAAAGVVLGFSFYFRFPTAFALVGLGLWLVFIKRPGIRILAVAALGFLLALGLNIVLDFWFYGKWTLTPVNYFLANLIDGQAVQYGVDPWWYYIEKLALLLAPPFSLILLLAILAAVILRPGNVLVWTVVCFVVGHSFIDHKETRFLMPVMYPLLILAVMGLEALSGKLALPQNPFSSSRVTRYFVYAFFGLNGLVLAYFSFSPASQEAVVHKWIYRQSIDAPFQLATYGQDPYQDGSGTIGFFRSSGVGFIKIGSPQEFQNLLDSTEEALYVFVPQVYPPATLLSLCADFTLQASALPNWIRRIDRQRWLSELRIWSVYRCTLLPS